MAEDEGKAPRDEVMEAAVGTEQSSTGAGDHSKGEAETTAPSGDVEMGEEGEKSNGGNEGEKKAEEEKKRRSWSRSPQRSRSRSPRRRRSRERRRSSHSRERSSRHRRRSDRHRDDDRDYDRRHRSSRSDRYRRERDYERDYERDRRDYDRDRHYRSRKRSREYDDDEERHSRSKRRRSYSRSPHRRERSGRSAWDSRAPATDASDEHLSDVEKARRYAERQQQQMFRNQHSHAKFAPPPAANMACRIYAGNMPYDGVTEEMVREVFAPYGPLKAINMVPDNQTGEFRGFCFIDFQQPEQAVAAQALDGQMFAGRPLRIGPPALPRGGHGYAPSPVPGGRMFVGSVSYDMTADDVGDLCKLFGEVFSCQLIPNPDNGRHKGYGFVEFSTAAAAKRAIIQLEGFEFGGRTLHTGEAKSQPGDGSPSSEATALAPEVDIAKLNAVARQLEQRAMARPPPLPMGHRRPPPAGMHGGPPGMYGGPRRGPPGMGRGVPEKPKQLHRNIPLAGMPQHMLLAIGNQQNKNSLSKEDDISISGKQRFLVMQKLANQMKECKTVCLRNMVTIDEVDDELEEEVTEECAKFGEVEKVVIYEEPLTRGNVDVQVYVFFKTLEASKRAQEALNGRFFAKKQIIAEFAPTTPF